jgi:Uma2 family endonuclease
MSTQPKLRYTLEEYLELDRVSDERLEFWDGEIFSMSGVSSRKTARTFRNSSSRAMGSGYTANSGSWEKSSNLPPSTANCRLKRFIATSKA